MEANPSFKVSRLNNEESLIQIVDQVRDVLKKMEKDLVESLEIIDTIQRLGLCNYFKEDVEALLYHQYEYHANISTIECDDLYPASLRFRLLRQQGFQVSPDDFFKKFLCDDGGELKFKCSETRAMIALFEASHLNVGGEEILYEAAIFSSHHLNDMVMRCIEEEEEEQVKMVKHCLLYPQHKSLSQFTAKKYLIFLNGNYAWENLLRDLTESEFVRTELVHKQEILEVVEWWKGMQIGLGEELKLSRNQPLKWHMWSMAILRDDKWSQHRLLLTKPISLVYVVDDIFDLYGEIHELECFTEAISRWDASATCQLPSYMKTCFKAIDDTTNEISNFISQEYGWNPIHFLRKEWGSLMEAFLIEAKWFRNNEPVNADEYLKNGVISSGAPMVLSHLFFLMGNPLTIQNKTLLNDPHGLTHSVAKLLRLLDDLGSAQDEKQDGYDGSYVEYYMREGLVDSLEGAREHVMGMVWETWENINKHALSSTNHFSECFRESCLNAARMVPTMYTYDQDHRLPLLKNYVKSMFSDATLAKSILG